MNNRTIFMFILIISGLTMLNPSFAQQQKDCDKGILRTQGTSIGYQSPDTATINIAVETRAKTVVIATEENKQKTNNVLNAIKKLINTSIGESIKTTSYNIQPIYEYNETTRKQDFVGYNVLNAVTVRLKETDKVGNIIDSAINNGANNIQNISFTIEDEQKYCKSLITEATNEARSKAESLGSALGLTIKGVKQASATCGGGGPISPPMPFAYAAREKDMAQMSTPIESGDIRLNASVDVEFLGE